VEQKQVERVGGSRPVTFDVRIIAATNQDLRERVEDKQFRADLYYRLNVAAIHLPPLRERREDVAVLAAFFLGCNGPPPGGRAPRPGPLS
jgi:two-component system response regulator AtoC